METQQLLILIAIGFTAGILGGTLGVGGGIIVVPALVYFFAFDQRLAQGTSMAFMLPPVTLLATWNYAKHGQVNWKYAIILSIGFLIGGLAGSQIANLIPTSILKKIFGGLMLIIAIRMIFSK